VKPGRRSGQIVRPLNLIASGHVRFPCSTSALNSMHTSRLVVVLLLAPKLHERRRTPPWPTV